MRNREQTARSGLQYLRDRDQTAREALEYMRSREQAARTGLEYMRNKEQTGRMRYGVEKQRANRTKGNRVYETQGASRSETRGKPNRSKELRLFDKREPAVTRKLERHFFFDQHENLRNKAIEKRPDHMGNRSIYAQPGM